MAIKNIEMRKHDIHNGELATIVAVKINEIIDYINGQDQFSDNSGKVEQEPNKVELNQFPDTNSLQYAIWRIICNRIWAKKAITEYGITVQQIETYYKHCVWDKVELVPLEVRKVLNEINKVTIKWMDVKDQHKIGRMEDEIFVILSKYWVPTQKKFTEWIVWEWLVKSGRISHEDSAAERYWVDMIYAFLEEKWMLEE